MFAAKECLLQHIGGVLDGEKHQKTDRKTLKGRQNNKLQLNTSHGEENGSLWEQA